MADPSENTGRRGDINWNPLIIAVLATRASRPSDKARAYQALHEAQDELIEMITGGTAAGHQIRLRVIQDRAEVTIEGNGPLAPGRYRGTVARLADSMGKVTP